ncbi:MAG: polyprenyl diphosphate synthase [Pseudomonadota bacterium]
MDGNGRWATKRGLGRSHGHRAGSEAVRTIVAEARTLGIEYLTLYTFSQENWNRPKNEVTFLFELLVEFLTREIPDLERQHIALNVLGDMAALPAPARLALNHAIKRTAAPEGQKPAMTLNLALNYSGRNEIVRACQALLQSGIPVNELDEDCISRHLYTAGQPDPDLVIRTSGEIRISNFLLFQCAYSEFYFTDTLWPDFGPDHLREALATFANRSRRFGRV